jgi:hypothetical protein
MMDARVAGRRGGQRLIWIVGAESTDGSHYIPSNDATAGDLVVVVAPRDSHITTIATIQGGRREERGVWVTLGNPRVDLGKPTRDSAETNMMLNRVARTSAERDVERQNQLHALLGAIDNAYPLRATEARAVLGVWEAATLVPEEFHAELDAEARELYTHAARLGSYSVEDANLSFSSVAATLLSDS